MTEKMPGKFKQKTIPRLVLKNLFFFPSGSMKRFLNFNFGLDEVSVSDEKGAEGGSGETGETGKDLFDMVCKDRFSSIDNDEEGEEKQTDSGDEEDEDPWASRTKEIKFDIAGTSDGGKGETSKAEKAGSSDDEDGKDGTKMEVDDEWSALDRRATEVAPIDMDIGNPWDSAGAASSPTHESSFDEAFSSASAGKANPTTSSGVTDGGSGKDAVNSDEGWANFSAFQTQESEASKSKTPDDEDEVIDGKPINEQTDESRM